MTILARCSKCGTAYKFLDNQTGRVLPCKKCGNGIEVRCSRHARRSRDDEPAEPLFLDDTDGPQQLPSRQLITVGAIVVAICFAIPVTLLLKSLFPWVSVIAAVALISAGSTFAAWGPFSERLATIFGVAYVALKRRLSIGVPIAAYGLLLLALSQSSIRENWRVAEARTEVENGLKSANAAFESEHFDEALAICIKLDSIASSYEKSQIADVRARVQARVQSIKKNNQINAANAKVIRHVGNGKIHLIGERLIEAQIELEAAFNVTMAIEFGSAKEFAKVLRAARVKIVSDFINEGEDAKEKAQLRYGVRIPSAKEKTKSILADICNQEVTELVASARMSFAEKNHVNAIAKLERALAIRDATEIKEAKKLLFSVRIAKTTEDEAVANRRVSALLGEARRSRVHAHFRNARNKLNEARNIPNSTKNAEVLAELQNLRNDARNMDHTTEVARARGAEVGLVDGKLAGEAAGFATAKSNAATDSYRETLNQLYSSGAYRRPTIVTFLVVCCSFLLGFGLQYVVLFLLRRGKLLYDIDRIVLGKFATKVDLKNLLKPQTDQQTPVEMRNSQSPKWRPTE